MIGDALLAVVNFAYRVFYHAHRDHVWQHERNIYGNEIELAGGRRSWWGCALCPAGHLEESLYVEPTTDRIA